MYGKEVCATVHYRVPARYTQCPAVRRVHSCSLSAVLCLPACVKDRHSVFVTFLLCRDTTTLSRRCFPRLRMHTRAQPALARITVRKQPWAAPLCFSSVCDLCAICVRVGIIVQSAFPSFPYRCAACSMSAGACEAVRKQ